MYRTYVHTHMLTQAHPHNDRSGKPLIRAVDVVIITNIKTAAVQLDLSTVMYIQVYTCSCMHVCPYPGPVSPPQYVRKTLSQGAWVAQSH